jgi:Pentapeptide repeats (8 copies)
MPTSRWVAKRAVGFLASFMIVFLLSSPAAPASSLSSQKEALDIIDEFAERLCEADIRTQGSGEKLELSGEARAELNNLLKKLANVGVRVSGKSETSTYEGLLQKDLAVVLQSARKCKLEVFRELKDKLLQETPPSTSLGTTRSGQSGLSQVVAEAIKGLGATKGEDLDLQTRLAAIATLRLEALNNPPHDYFPQAVDLLVTYVRTNIGDRKRPGPGIKRDKQIPTYLAEDIIAAMKALQVIRTASGGTVEVKLTSIDFDNVSLAPSDGLDLSYFDFSHSSFKNAFLSNCKCHKTNFSFGEFYNTATWNADFSGVNFHKANLWGAKFANVTFEGSNIEEARDHRIGYFADIRGLTSYQRSLFRR